jgi:pimeloyl-ACP methyl ester carboxylesterase
LLSEGELARSLPIWLKELEERGPLAFYRARPREARVSVLGPWERATAQRLGTLPELEEYEEKLSAAAQALPEEEQAALYAAEVRNLAAYLKVDLLPQLKELRTPVLIVHGDQDQVVPLRAAYDLHRAIPGSTLEVFPGVPHGILGFSREARLRILQFLREVDEGTVRGG